MVSRSDDANDTTTAAATGVDACAADIELLHHHIGCPKVNVLHVPAQTYVVLHGSYFVVSRARKASSTSSQSLRSFFAAIEGIGLAP